MRRHTTALAVVLVVFALTFSLHAKRRAVRSPCNGPTLTLTVSPQTACPADAVTVTWRASDSKALVWIEGVGENLRWTGSTRVLDGRRTFTGYAANTCSRGAASSVSVRLPDPPSGSISAAASIRQHTSTTLHVNVAGSTSWWLTSALANPIAPASGVGTGQATYTGSRSGTDAVTLRLTGQCDVSTSRVASLIVEPAAAPPPPPPPAGLRCCDGTRSPTCFSCANKRGCCSGHGGVCGC